MLVEKERNACKSDNMLMLKKNVKNAFQPFFNTSESASITSKHQQQQQEQQVLESKKDIKVIHQRLLHKVRRRIIQQSKESPDKYYKEDVERIKRNDWSVMRFIPDDDFVIVTPESLDRISESIDLCLKWRKSYGIREIQIKSFPSEFFTIGLFEFGTNAATNRSVIYIRANKYKKISELTEHFQRFGSCLYEMLDSLLTDCGQHRMTAFLDLKDVSLDNVDVPIFRHFLDLMFNYFPSILQEAYVVDVSWILRPIVFLLLKVIPDRYAKLVRFVTRNDLLHEMKYDASGIPTGIGGALTTYPLKPADDAISLQDYVRLHNIPQSIVCKAKRVYKL